MLLLDKTVEPHNTVFYLSLLTYELIRNGVFEPIQLYDKVQYEIKEKLNYDFFILALDFLFLLNKININKKGELVIVY